MFHVKHFGKINARRQSTFARRREVRPGDLGQAQFRGKIKFWFCDFWNARIGLLEITEIGCDGCNLRLRQAMGDRFHNG